MKCRKCGQKAVIKIVRHHTAFCREDFDQYFLGQVKKAVHDEKMLAPSDSVLVAVSGGKDSLTLWDILQRLGYSCTGLHVDQGIGDYSVLSRDKTQAFAASRKAELIIHDLRTEDGGGVLELADTTHRSPCSACGTVKRYHFNRIALDKGFSVVATGHNLDDEAARLMGNVLHWQWAYLEKQDPALPADHPGWAKKVKPLYRLSEYEISAYAVLRGIDYVVEECPMAGGSKLLLYKDLLNRLEEESPGTKQAFYFGFLEAREVFRHAPDIGQKSAVKTCERCGQPTTALVCGYCRLMEQMKARTR